MIIQIDYIKVNMIVFFQIGGSEEVVYYLIYIYVVGMWYNYQVGWVFVVRFIVQIVNYWQFFVVYLCSNLFQYVCI